MSLPNSCYANVDSHLVSTGGAQFGIVLAAATGTRAVTSTTPCKEAYISAGSSSLVHFGIDSSVLVNKGACIPASSTGDTLGVIIDDVNKLWFYATTGASVFITYRQ